MNYDETNYNEVIFHPGDTIIFNCADSYKTIILPPGKFLIERWKATNNKRNDLHISNHKLQAYTSDILELFTPKELHITSLDDQQYKNADQTSSFNFKTTEDNIINAYNDPMDLLDHYDNNQIIESKTNDMNINIKITVITVFKHLFLIDNKIQYFANNRFNILANKNINNIMIEDFLTYGSSPNTVELDNNNKNITVLSLNDSISLQNIPNNVIIYESLSKQRWNINQVNKIVVDDIGDIIYMIYNGEYFYTWKNGEWGKYHCNNNIFSTNDISNMKKYGMTSIIINNITKNGWDQLWSSVDSYKIITFCAIFNPQVINEEIRLKEIKIQNSSFIRQVEIADSMFEEKNTIKELILKWNTTDKSKIKIIYQK